MAGAAPFVWPAAGAPPCVWAAGFGWFGRGAGGWPGGHTGFSRWDMSDGWFGPGAGGGWAPTARRDSLTHVLLKGFTVSMMLSDTELDIAVDGLRNLGYAVVHTSGESAALMLAARDLGRRIGARTFGYVHLRADGSPGWLGRHTESLTDSSTPLRYFALGCHIRPWRAVRLTCLTENRRRVCSWGNSVGLTRCSSDTGRLTALTRSIIR